MFLRSASLRGKREPQIPDYPLISGTAQEEIRGTLGMTNQAVGSAV
jgi:hypothetical protein